MPRRDNRKRIRHRPHRAARHRTTQISSPPFLQPHIPTAPSMTMATAFSPIPPTLISYHSSCVHGKTKEDARTRDLRIFGGLPAEDEAGMEVDLRGRMLDVVLGLFDAVDYDDGLC